MNRKPSEDLNSVMIEMEKVLDSIDVVAKIKDYLTDKEFDGIFPTIKFDSLANYNNEMFESDADKQRLIDFKNEEMEREKINSRFEILDL